MLEIYIVIYIYKKEKTCLDVGEIPTLVEKDGVSQWVLLRLVKNNWSRSHQATTPIGVPWPGPSRLRWPWVDEEGR